MKIRVKVNGVEVTIEGLEPTMRRTRRLMRDAADIARSVTPGPADIPPIGFTATVERADHYEPPAYYTDDEDHTRKGERPVP